MTADFEQRVAECKRAIRAASVEGIQRRHTGAAGSHYVAEAAGVELRAADDSGYTIAGYAAVFGSKSENLGGFREVIEPGAFAKVLGSKPDVKALLNHDTNLILSSTSGGSLGLKEDSRGLHYRADVPSGLYYGDALKISLGRGDVDKSSFAFRVARDGDRWEEDEETGGLLRRILPNGISGLFDVSPVAMPAYNATTVDLASVTPPDGESGAWRLASVKRNMKAREKSAA